jgi:DNA-binding beta-propeller fold protein YncE
MKHTLILLFLLISSVVAFTQPEVSFDDNHRSVDENGGSATVSLELSQAYSMDVTATVYILSGIGTAHNGVDFTYNEMEYTFPANSTANIDINIPIIDDELENGDRFFALGIQNVTNGILGDVHKTGVFILDDEETAPTAQEALGIEFKNSYLVDGEGSAEILDYDPTTQRIYVLNSTATKVEVLDFSDPMNITSINSIDMTQFGNGATSIAVRNGVVAATVEGGDQMRGEVVFLDLDGNIINDVMVGYLPDMLTFTHDGTKVLVANEGEPNDNYSVDPEGSVSIIDISGGIEGLTQSDVSEVIFHAFDPFYDELKEDGVRLFGYNATVSRDLEPEYITISEDDQKAWVACQENNALVVIDIPNATAVEIMPLGTKDHSMMKNAIDQTDKTDFIYFGEWNIYGMFHPDAIASYTVNGTTYIVTANEGDQREYGDVIDEDTGVEDLTLDPMAYPHANLLQQDEFLGRIAATPYNGDTDGDGDIDMIHTFGARSFSIWNSETGEMVYDSGSDFEKITANHPVWGALFNASNSNNKFKNRSDNKGPEPEGVVIAKIDGRDYAIVGLERIGGIMTYDITDPMNPVFENYTNSRDLGEDEGGDLAPEGIIYISPEDSPVHNGIIVVANEESATISVYYLNNVYAPLEINATDKQVCYNGTVELGEMDLEDNDITVTGGSGDYTYSWSPAFRVDDATISNPSYGPVYYSYTGFTLNVTDNVTGETMTKSIDVTTLPQPSITAPLFKILSVSDYDIYCKDVTDWAQGAYEYNWFDVSLNNINEECIDFSSPGIHRIYVEGMNELGCVSRMKRIIVFTMNNKQTITGEDVAVSEDGIAFMYANPNPVVSEFNLFADFEDAAYLEVTISDMTGRKLMNFVESGTKSIDKPIDISEYTAGVYFVTISNGETTVTKKIVKQ